MKVPQIQAHGWDVYAEKNASAVKSEPAAAYTARRVFFRAARSAMMPRTGLESATKAVDMATPNPHNELPVKVRPRKEPLSPTASLKRKTK